MTVSYDGDFFVYSVYKRQRSKRELSNVHIKQGGFQAHSPASPSGPRGGQTRPADRQQGSEGELLKVFKIKTFIMKFQQQFEYFQSTHIYQRLAALARA